jgi:hypothetical protein
MKLLAPTLHDWLCELDWLWDCYCHERAMWREVLAAIGVVEPAPPEEKP